MTAKWWRPVLSAFALLLAVVIAGAAEPGPEEKNEEEAPGFLGIMVAPLPDEMKEIAGTDTGVLINSLADDSPATAAEMLPGDVVTELNGREVTEPAELIEQVRAHKPGDKVRITYYRMGEKREATVTLGERPRGRRAEEGPPPHGVPEEWLRNMPELREYLERLRPQIERWREETRRLPERPEAERGDTEKDTYGVGKDIGRILERLDALEEHLDALEETLDRELGRLEKMLDRMADQTGRRLDELEKRLERPNR
jgi:hypothetical protein